MVFLGPLTLSEHKSCLPSLPFSLSRLRQVLAGAEKSICQVSNHLADAGQKQTQKANKSNGDACSARQVLRVYLSLRVAMSRARELPSVLGYRLVGKDFAR